MPGHGTLLKESDTTIGEVITISGPRLDEEAINTESMSLEEYRDYLPAVSSSGEVIFTMAHVSGSEICKLADFFQDRTLRDFALFFPDEVKTVYKFSGYLTHLEVIKAFQITVRVTGMINVTSADTLWQKFKNWFRKLFSWRA